MNAVYVVYGCDEQLAQTLRRVLHGTLLIKDACAEPILRRARALIVSVTESTVRQLLQHLRIVNRRYPGIPVIVITDRQPETLRALLRGHVLAAAVVFRDAIATELPAALRPVVFTRWCYRAAATIDRSNIAPASLRSALSAAVRGPSPPRTVSDLARLAHCSRTTLWRQWRRTFGTGSPLSPADFVDIVLLVHAALRRRMGATWASIADELGVDDDTLRRAVKRHFGVLPQAYSGDGNSRLLRRTILYLLKALLRTTSTAAASDKLLLQQISRSAKQNAVAAEAASP